MCIGPNYINYIKIIYNSQAADRHHNQKGLRNQILVNKNFQVKKILGQKFYRGKISKPKILVKKNVKPKIGQIRFFLAGLVGRDKISASGAAPRRKGMLTALTEFSKLRSIIYAHFQTTPPSLAQWQQLAEITSYQQTHIYINEIYKQCKSRSIQYSESHLVNDVLNVYNQSIQNRARKNFLLEFPIPALMTLFLFRKLDLIKN